MCVPDACVYIFFADGRFLSLRKYVLGLLSAFPSCIHNSSGGQKKTLTNTTFTPWA